MTDFQVNCFGVSHHHAHVELRERLRFTLFDIRALMASGREDTHGNGSAAECPFSAIREMVLLSTCNRVELYVCMDADADSARNVLSDLVVEASRMARHQAGLPPDDAYALTPEIIEKVTYHHAGEEAIHHLCSVASGLDSMVLGETQILSQIKEAHENAVESGLAGPVLKAVFRAAEKAGKRARSQTAISSNPSSLSTAAVALARDHIDGLRDREAVVIGLGEMGQLALKTLCTRKVKCLRIVNRTAKRAMAIAEHIMHNTGRTCFAHSLEELPEAMKTADVVVTATGSNSPIIDVDLAKRIMDTREGRELVIVDIAVPRDVDPVVREVDGICLFDTDDIHTVQDEAVAARRREIPHVMAIIDEEMAKLEISLRKLQLKPLITELRQKAEAIRQHELERTYQKLGSPDPEAWSHVQNLSTALVKKLFHDPTIFLNEKAATGTVDSYAATIRELFGLKKTGESRG
jgi:glutamyl-tRNA reductase